jgi:hypothetical protein
LPDNNRYHATSDALDAGGEDLGQAEDGRTYAADLLVGRGQRARPGRVVAAEPVGDRGVIGISV